MRWLLGVPFVNRPDLLDAALASVKNQWPGTTVIDNSDMGLGWQPVGVLRPAVPLTFSQSNNLLQRLAARREVHVLLTMHHDARAGQGTLEQLLTLLGEAERDRVRWGVALTNYDALAAFSLDAIRDVGAWDVNLPHYFADNDYYRRLDLAGYARLETGLPVAHDEPSSTINASSRRRFLNGVTFPLDLRYYIEKWGGEPGEEAFDQPFNGLLPAPETARDFYKPEAGRRGRSGHSRAIVGPSVD